VRRDLGSNLSSRLGFESKIRALFLVVDSSLDLTLRLQSRDDVLVLPSNLMGESSKNAEFAVGLKSEYAKRRGNHRPLSLVVRCRNSLVGAVTFHGVLSTSQFMWQHTADRFVENSGGSPMVKGSAFWVNQTAFAKVVHVLEFVAIKASGDIDTFAPDNDDTLALEETFGDDRCKAAKEMTTAIDNQRFGGETHLDHS